MPLRPGASRATISQNIKEMEAAGHPRRVSIAAALDNARKTRKKGQSVPPPKKGCGKPGCGPKCACEK